MKNNEITNVMTPLWAPPGTTGAAKTCHDTIWNHETMKNHGDKAVLGVPRTKKHEQTQNKHEQTRNNT